MESPHPTQNRLLAALPDDVLGRLIPHLKLLPFALGKSVHEAGETLRHVFFPVNGIVSLVHATASGATAEVAMVGREGMVGLPLLMGAESAPFRAVVQSATQGFCLPLVMLNDELRRCGELQACLLRFANVLLAQVSQTALCNRHHSLEQQLCRWLLMSSDRLPDSELVVTHELIASMLGVRREGVTEGARKLQDAGLIRYTRGRITLLDREGLAARACECYGVVEKEYGLLR